MALVKCPDCNTEVSDQAEICPKCSRPKPASNSSNIADETVDKASSKFNFKPFIPFIIIGFLVFLFFSYRNTLVVESLSSKAPLFGNATVTATIYNKGGGIEVTYYVKLKNSETRYCSGKTYFAAEQRRTINFVCNALSNYNGTFSLITTTGN